MNNEELIAYPRGDERRGIRVGEMALETPRETLVYLDKLVPGGVVQGEEGAYHSLAREISFCGFLRHPTGLFSWLKPYKVKPLMPEEAREVHKEFWERVQPDCCGRMPIRIEHRESYGREHENLSLRLSALFSQVCLNRLFN